MGMWLGGINLDPETPQGITNIEKCTWRLEHIAGDKYYIINHKGEHLYRPADTVVCDKNDFGKDEKRVMALMWLGGMKLSEQDKAVWRIEAVSQKKQKKREAKACRKSASET